MKRVLPLRTLQRPLPKTRDSSGTATLVLTYCTGTVYTLLRPFHNIPVLVLYIKDLIYVEQILKSQFSISMKCFKAVLWIQTTEPFLPDPYPHFFHIFIPIHYPNVQIKRFGLAFVLYGSELRQKNVYRSGSSKFLCEKY